MTEQEARAEEPLRMSAYYYSFEPTGVIEIDRILSAVARAGKAYHYTEQWDEDTGAGVPVDWIQAAANEAAARLSPRVVVAAPSDTDRKALAWADRHNDVWVFPGGGDTGYSFETQPFSREHIEKKWGPLAPLSRASQPVQVEVTDEMVATAWNTWMNHRGGTAIDALRAALSAALGGGE